MKELELKLHGDFDRHQRDKNEELLLQEFAKLTLKLF